MAVQVGHYLHAGSMLGRCYHAARLGASGMLDVAAGDLLSRRTHPPAMVPRLVVLRGRLAFFFCGQLVKQGVWAGSMWVQGSL